MMNTVAPVWDGNETWLVLGGAGLLAAFPLAYAVVLSAFYLPLIFMLLGLIFRGVAFEFRFKASAETRGWWDKAFIGGSVLRDLLPGRRAGRLHRWHSGGGRPLRRRTAFDWLTPFPLFTGVGLLAAYALLGSTWLVMKTDGRAAAAHEPAGAQAWPGCCCCSSSSSACGRRWRTSASPQRWFTLAQHAVVRAGAAARAG